MIGKNLKSQKKVSDYYSFCSDRRKDILLGKVYFGAAFKGKNLLSLVGSYS